MLTYDDCLDFAGFTPDEILIIARHEHMPPILALEMAEAMCADAEGVRRLRHMIEDALLEARTEGDGTAVRRDREALRHFRHTHPPRPH